MQGKTFTAIIAAEKFTIPRRFMLDKSKEEDKDQESIQSCTPRDPGPRTPYGKVTKIQENTTHKGAKRPALSSR